MTVWDLTTDSRVRTYHAGDKPVTELAYSPDGRWLAATARATGKFMSSEGPVCVWDAATGQVVRTWTDGRAGAFTPDGRALAVVCADGTVRVRAVESGEDRLTLRTEGLADGGFDLVTVSPEGRRLAASRGVGHGGGVVLWDVATGRDRRVFQAGDYVGILPRRLRFSPDMPCSSWATQTATTSAD